ncbi:uncharacterized protein METZ01_LOCUS57199 [marine metagenome]|uniref:VWFA domain-containing protein n=1 Tax=marine metagenome TaxID=408172 RepID=A0A381SJY6_9ZZZZ
MPRFFTNPFGWDWLPKGENIVDIMSPDEECWSPWGGLGSNTFQFDKWEDYKKTARIFEEIKDVEITLKFGPENKSLTTQDKKDLAKYGRTHNRITSYRDKFFININPNGKKYLTNYAILEHCLSHIAYDSPVKLSRQQAKRLSLGSAIPKDIKVKPGMTADCSLVEDVLRYIFDILEDERCNSLWTDIYLGTANDYEDCKKDVRAVLRDDPTNPLEALWYAFNGKIYEEQLSAEAQQFFARPDWKKNLIGTPEYLRLLNEIPFQSMIAKEYLKAVRKTDYGGALHLQHQYFQKVFLPWLLQQDNTEKQDDPNNPGKEPPKLPPTGIPPYGCGYPNPTKPKDQLESLINSIQRVRSKDSAFPGHEGLLSPLNNKKTKRGTKLITSSDNPKGTFNDSPSDESGGSGKSYDLFDPKKIEQLKQEGEQRNTRLRKKLVTKGLVKDDTNDAYNFNPDAFDIIKREPTDNPYKIDQALVQKLRQVWRQAKGKTREIIDEEGIDIDVDSYIQELPQPVKDNIIYTNERQEPGLHIVYSVDCSGSMSGYPLKLVRDVTATIKKSLEYEPKIKMSMIGWGGGNKTGISVHKTMDDINNFTCANHYGGTPEANALWYSSTWLQRQRELTKAIFFVSDGAFSRDSAREQVDIARSHGLHVFGICIGHDNEYMGDQHRYIFGPGNYTIIDSDYENGVNTLTRDISKFISRHIQTVY